MSSERSSGKVASHQLAVTTHGHYLLRPAAGGESAPLVVGCHGYGETAADLMRQLDRIPGASAWHLCAPQGLNSFYRKTGEVVASWMTSFNRELAIADNVAYVRAVIDAVAGQVEVAGQPAFVGFSQGVAMAYRAAAAIGEAAVVALAGDLPPEIAADQLGQLTAVLIGRGEQDAWYDEAKLELDRSRLAAAGRPPETLVFPQGHVWTEDFRAAAGRFLTDQLRRS